MATVFAQKVRLDLESAAATLVSPVPTAHVPAMADPSPPALVTEPAVKTLESARASTALSLVTGVAETAPHAMFSTTLVIVRFSALFPRLTSPAPAPAVVRASKVFVPAPQVTAVMHASSVRALVNAVTNVCWVNTALPAAQIALV